MKRKESPTSVEGISLLENDTTPRIETNTNQSVELISHYSLISHPEVEITGSGYLAKLRRLKQKEPLINPNYAEGVPPDSEDGPQAPDSSRAVDCEISELCEKSSQANLNCAQETAVVGELPKNLTYVVDALTLEQVLPKLSQAELLAFDLETYSSDPNKYPNGGLDPHIGSIRLINLAINDPDGDTIEGGTKAFLIDCIACPSWTELLRPVFSNPQITKIAHNAKFDVKFLMKVGIEVENVFDTMLAAQVLHSGQPAGKGYFTLAAVSKRYLGISLDKTEQTSDWGAHELSQEQLEYAARDAAVLVRLYARLSADLETSSLYGTMQLEMEATPFLAWMEFCGVALDTQRWKKLALQAATEKANLEPEILELMTKSIGEGSTPRRKITPASPKQVMTVLSRLGVDVDDTKHETLIGVQGRHPFIANLLAYRGASKRHSTYGIKFLEHVLPTTGRIHANFQQIGAATGRMSCGGPNLQNIPKASGYRECFRSSEGKVMVIADLSLIELCVATQLSGDEKMRKAVERGDDLHLLTAAALFQREPGEITVEERAFGKSVNFGTLYGQGRNGLIQQASKQGLLITNLEAGRFLKRFAETWPQLYAWSRQQMASSGTDIRTLSGRRRLLGPLDGGTKRVNTPVQGVAADGFKKAMALLWKQRKQFPTAVPVLAVHDELVLECDETDARAVGEWVTGALQVGMGEYVTKVPIRVDVKIAQTWAG